MQPFEHLSRRRQVARLRRLAAAALAAYDLPAARLSLLAHGYNTSFRVDTTGGRRYVLRISRSGTPTVERVGAELAWLAALRRDTHLGVPAPVPTRDGPLLTVATAQGVPPSICVLFGWLDGRILNASLAPAHLERVGELMAALQNHAALFGPPRAFARGRVDGLTEAARQSTEPFAPGMIAACGALVAETLSAEEARLVVAVIEHIAAVQRALGRGPAAFGLMHADLHHNNLLFARGAVRAIDFDDCGFGPLLFDMGVTLSDVHDRPTYPALRAALLAGYRRVRPLPPEHEEAIDSFIALRRLQDALWGLEAHRQAAIAPNWQALARRSLAPMAGFLAAGGRFPPSID